MRFIWACRERQNRSPPWAPSPSSPTFLPSREISASEDLQVRSNNGRGQRQRSPCCLTRDPFLSSYTEPTPEHTNRRPLVDPGSQPPGSTYLYVFPRLQMVGHPGGRVPWRPHHTLQLGMTNVHGEEVVGRFLSATVAAAMTAEYEAPGDEGTPGGSRGCVDSGERVN